MSFAKEKLEKISEEITNSPVSIQRVSDLYFESKEILFGSDDIGKFEGLAATNIFMQGYAKVYKKCSDWIKGNFVPSDEELDLLMSLCDEASMNFDYLTGMFSSLSESLSSTFSSENNKEKQEEIQDLREKVSREKAERKVQKDQQNSNSRNDNYEDKVDDEKKILLDESSQKRIDELQKLVDNLRKKQKNNEADKLKKRIDVIRLEKDNPQKDNPQKDNFFSPTSFLIGGGLVLSIVIIFFLVIKKSSKKKHQ